MATKVKKVTKAELEKIQQAVGAVNRLTNQLGQMEIAKAATMGQVQEAQQVVQAEQKSLEEKYGSVTISLETGEITETKED